MLETGAVEASEAPVLRRHVVVVLVDRLDLATARALQYARTLTPDDLRAVHFDIDTKAAARARGRVEPARAGPPARSTSSSARTAGSGGPPWSWWPTRRPTATPSARCCCRGAAIAGVWQRLLHDRTADKIAAVLGQVPHVSATIVPFDVGGRIAERVRSYGRSVQRARGTATSSGRRRPATGPTPAQRSRRRPRRRAGRGRGGP